MFVCLFQFSVILVKYYLHCLLVLVLYKTYIRKVWRRNSKDRQCNGQKKKDKRTNDDLPSITQKIKN